MRHVLLPRLVFILTATTMLVAAGLDVVLVVRAERTRRLAAAEAMLEQRAELFAERLARGLEGWFALMHALAGRRDLAEAAEPAALLRRTLTELSEEHPDLAWLGLMDGRGVILAGSDPIPPLNAPPRLAALAMARQGLVLDGPHDHPGGPKLDLAIPLQGRILVAQIALGWAQRLQGTLERAAPLPVRLDLRGPEGALRLAARPREPLTGTMISASAPVTVATGPRGWISRASTAPDRVLDGLQGLAVRLALGTVALALLAGLLAAQMARALGSAGRPVEERDAGGG